MIEFENILDNMHENTHTIHAIVSPLASNDMANVLLSLNQAPFLAEYHNEVYEVTKFPCTFNKYGHNKRK